MSDLHATPEQREKAYKMARTARGMLDKAAQELGFSDATELSLQAPQMEFDREEDEAVQAITNAHSHLNNGSLEHLDPDE